MNENVLPSPSRLRNQMGPRVGAGSVPAATETAVYVSFNDGEQWQPLQLNLPVTPVNDLLVKNNDLVVATPNKFLIGG